jgi:hypothetical protein
MKIDFADSLAALSFMRFDFSQRYGILTINPTVVSQVGNYTLYVTLSDDNPT